MNYLSRMGMAWMLACLFAGLLAGPVHVPADAAGEPKDRILTLEAAMAAALEHNFDLASSRVRTSLSEVGLDIAESDFRWDVRPGLSLRQNREDQTVTRMEARVSKRTRLGALFQVRGEWTTREEGEDSHQVDLRLEQPLFRRFGKLSALEFVDAARHRLKLARWSLQREAETMMLRVVRAYLETIRQAGRVEREREAVARATDLTRLVEIRKNQGRATGVELLEMRMAEQEAALRLRRAEEGVKQARLTLAGLLGRAPEQLPLKLAPPKAPAEDPPSVGEAEALARNYRVERLQVYARYEDARRRLRLQKREFFPDVRLVADYRPLSSVDDEGDWTVGVAIGQELDRSRVRFEFDRETREVRAALLDISALELRLIREVRSAHAAYRVAEAEAELAKGRLELAERRLRLSRTLYPLGRVTAQQLREAEEALVREERERVETDLSRLQTLYELWHAAGRLAEDVPDEDATDEKPVSHKP